MGTLAEEALAYKPKLTKNISELPEVSTDLKVEDRTGKDKQGKDFDYQVVCINDEEYRVPQSVLGNLKIIMEDNPKLQKFKVKKTGTGMNSEYTVIPLA